MLDIISIQPPIPCCIDFVQLESFTVTVTLRYPSSTRELRPQVWTNVLHKKNPDGKWHAVDMHLLESEMDGTTHHFRATLILTGQGTFEFTTRVGFISDPESALSAIKLTDSTDEIEYCDDEVDFWKWAGGWGNNGRITVHPPNDKAPWTNGPQAVEIAPNVYVGNFIAASHAKELGFTAVLNMAAELDNLYPPDSNIKYKKIGLPDGSHNPIPLEIVLEAVSWIQDTKASNSKVLIHCRAGIGRSGSIGIAYLYSNNKAWSFKDTLKAIWRFKPDIYPHRDLDKCLDTVFKRERDDTSN